MKKKFSLTIKGLFGQFNYEIVLDEQYKFLTGLNGSGKTTILKILQALSERDLGFFRYLNFQYIIYEDEEDYINIEKTKDKILLNSKNQTIIWSIEFSKLDKIEKEQFEELYFTYNYLDNDYIDTLEEKKITLGDIYIKGGINWLDFIKKINYNIYIIKEQRLLKIEASNHNAEESILIYSNQLKFLLSAILANNAKITNSLDRSFPQRLLESTRQGKKISKQEFDKRLKKIQLIQEKFVQYFNQGQISNTMAEFNEEAAATLYVYMDDMEKKLEGYRDIIEKLDLFVSTIKSKHFTNKIISIDSENGITFKTTDESNTIIKLSDLSSGEKQEVILLYNLLFNMPEGSVLLIDEPETSLHVAWAKEFMDDIEKILKLKKSQALIATHSPFIIGERWAQTIDLTAMSASPRSKAWS